MKCTQFLLYFETQLLFIVNNLCELSEYLQNLQVLFLISFRKQVGKDFSLKHTF